MQNLYKKEGGKKDDADRSPAVEGVEETHDGILVFKRTGLDDGTDQHLNESAADGVDDDGEKDADKGVRKERGEEVIGRQFP